MSQPGRGDSGSAGAVSIGLVGCGRMGRLHLQAIADGGGARLAGVVDPGLERGELEDGCPVRDLADLLRAPDVSALLVASPTPTHGEIVRAALEYGKHVLCEKPLTLDPLADAALGRLAAARGLVLQVGFWRRFALPYAQLRGVLAAGEIGSTTALRGAQWDATPPAPAFCDPAVSGGLEVDCGVHEFDMARWLTGREVEAVAAWAPPPSPPLAAVGDVDTVFGLARLRGGSSLAVDMTRTGGYADAIRTEVICERGSVVVEFAEHGSMEVRGAGRRELTEFGQPVIGQALVAQLKAFAGAVRERRPHPDAATAADSASALSAAVALRAARLGGEWMEPAHPAGLG